MRFPPLAHRSAAAHKLHSTAATSRIDFDSGKGATFSRQSALSLFFPEPVQTTGTIADGIISISRIRWVTGLSELSLKWRFENHSMDAVIQELGIGTKTKPLVLPETNEMWRHTFDGFDAVRNEARCLVAACYIVIAYLSGMRDSEVQDMRRGCYRVRKDANGLIVRHKVVSIAYKGIGVKRGETGLKRTWVVLAQVGKAVTVLEELLADTHKRTDTDALFMNPIYQLADNNAIAGRMNDYLRSFIAKIAHDLEPRLGDKLSIPRIPKHAGVLPHVTTRMFRRTIAWHIANQPFGIIAGMIQYGHSSQLMFEGYAGTSASGFRAEVEAEQAMARKADILEAYEDSKRGIKPSGPMAETLESEFRNIREEIGDFPGVIVDQRRREKMLEHLRTRLHPGLLADCFFSAAEAKCLAHLKPDERAEPVTGLCNPDCPNACWLKKHLKVWEHKLEDTRRLGCRNRISPIQRGILKTAASRYERIISSIKEASGAGKIDRL